jgi:hypothetical protein
MLEREGEAGDRSSFEASIASIFGGCGLPVTLITGIFLAFIA